MAKRLTDTDKWKKNWFRTMDPEYKCFWYFIVDYCDFAGVWDVDFDLAEFYIGKKIDREKIKEFFSKHVDVLDDGRRWFITDFILFQYGEKLKNGHPFHQKIIDRLNKVGLIKKYFILKGGYYYFDKNSSNTLFDRVSDTLSSTHKNVLNEKTAEISQDRVSDSLSYTLLEKKENDKNEESDTLSDRVYDREKEERKEKDKEEEEEKEEVKEEWESEFSIKNTFDRFWQAYDKKIARLNCEKIWIVLTQEERLDALNYVPDYVASTPDKQFRLHPQKFLEEKYWTNEIVKPQLNGNKNGSSKKISGPDIVDYGKRMWGSGDKPVL